MKQFHGFVTVGGLLVSALVGLGGFGSLAFVANIHQLLPNNTWTEVFREKGDAFAFVSKSVDDVLISDQIQASEDSTVQTPTPTPVSVVTVSPTPIPVSPTLTPTPTPKPVELEDDDSDDNSDEDSDDQSEREEKERERKHKNIEKESLRVHVRSDSETSSTWWLKYKLMVFGKTN